MIVEIFDVKFDDCDIPPSEDPLNIVEVNYDHLFDPIPTTQLSEVLVSTEAQQQHADVSGPTPSEDVSLNHSSSLVERESSTSPVQLITTEVPINEDVAPISLSRTQPQPIIQSDSDDEIENIETRADPRVFTIQQTTS